jgi:hypothetical protein
LCIARHGPRRTRASVLMSARILTAPKGQLVSG